MSTATTIVPAALVTLLAAVQPIQRDGGTTPIQTITAPVDSGDLITFVSTTAATGFASGGNINFTGVTSPWCLQNGQSVTLRKLDYQYSSTSQFVTPPPAIPAAVPIRSGSWQITSATSMGVIFTTPT